MAHVDASTVIEENTATSPQEAVDESVRRTNINSFNRNSQDDPNSVITFQRPPLRPFNTSSAFFDIDFATKSFEESMVDKESIVLHHYLNGFKELMKFLNSLGTIFLFVTSDLETKIGLLEKFRALGENGRNLAYLTILQSAIDFESKEDLWHDTKNLSVARTILRLHRALGFLSKIMCSISKLDDHDKTGPSARDAYDAYLARYHPWAVRK